MIYQRLSLLLLLACVLGTTAAAQQSAAGGDFTLTDHNGEKFRLADHRGKVILLFFGYTSCTEACPVILSRVNSVFKQLGPERGKTLAVFISVDPQRDTPQVLREYVYRERSCFSPNKRTKSTFLTSATAVTFYSPQFSANRSESVAEIWTPFVPYL